MKSIVYAPQCFNGTSSATPVAAGAAALVLDAGAANSPATLKSYLLNATVDRGAAGTDNVYGRGELLLPTPPSGDTTPPRNDDHLGPGRRLHDHGHDADVRVQLERGRHVPVPVRRRRVLAVLEPAHAGAALSAGAHTFQVRAIDAANNVDPTPASRAFSVQTTPPPDTVPPSAIAHDSKGKAGKRAKLLFDISDDRGVARAVIGITKGGSGWAR